MILHNWYIFPLTSILYFSLLISIPFNKYTIESQWRSWLLIEAIVLASQRERGKKQLIEIWDNTQLKNVKFYKVMIALVVKILTKRNLNYIVNFFYNYHLIICIIFRFGTFSNPTSSTLRPGIPPDKFPSSWPFHLHQRTHL